MQDDFQVFDNPQARCPVALLLDCSGSMTGAPFEELKKGLQLFFDEIRNDDFARFAVEIEIVTFRGAKAERHTPFLSFAPEKCPYIPELPPPHGKTPMGAAVAMALDDLEQRKKSYKDAGLSYYQPWLVILSDGQPNDDWQATAEKSKKLANEGKLVVIAVGIGDQVELETLSKFCADDKPAKKLNELNFSEFFEWLSQSLSGVSRSTPSDDIHLPPTDSWVTLTSSQ